MKTKLLYFLLFTITFSSLQSTFAQVNPGSFSFSQLTTSATNGVAASGSNIYVATTAGLLVSSDNGTNFSTKTTSNGLGSNNVKDVFVDVGIIYAATTSGLSVSVDGGNTFVNYAPASFAYGNSFNDVYANGDNIYALASNRLFISTDAGATFTEKQESDGIGSSIFRGVVANGTDVYIASDGGLSISTDGGATFTNKTKVDGLANNGANGVAFSNGVLYTASEGFSPVGGLSISTDKGNTFNVMQQSDGLAANSVNTVFSKGSNVFVGTSGSSISVSNDGGATFTIYRYDDGIIGVVNDIYFDDTNKIYVSTNQGLVVGEEAFPEITVIGNNTSIVNQSTFTDSTNDTDFGIAAATITKTFTIKNDSFVDVLLTGTAPNFVTISGSSDFTILAQPNSNTIAKGTSKTFQVAYNPSMDGNQTATISIANNDATKNPFTFTVSGVKGQFSNYNTTYEPVNYNPNGLTSIGIFSNANFADLDNDGDLDLLSGGRTTNFYYFENTGSNAQPVYAAVQNNPFGLTNISRDSFPTFVDIDGDGDMDIISGAGTGEHFYFENTGTIAAPQYAAPIEAPFGISNISASSSYPTFGDIDNDGDLDLLTGSTRNSAQSPNFFYFENTGTATAPQFGSAKIKPFGLTLSVPLIRPSFGDLDADGDLDLIAGVQGGEFLYFENIGNAQTPGYAASVSNAFGFSGMNGFSTPTFIDYDFDGDLDVMTGGSGGNFRYYQNGPSPVNIQIPDAVFEQRLIDLGIDTDGIVNGEAKESDLEIVTTLSAGIFAIKDLTGIEAFRDLEILNVYNAQITSIDLSNNLKLRELYLGNQNNTLATLTSLDITNNVLLEKLDVVGNQITALDVSQNPNLVFIDVAGNQLTALDVTNLPLLEELDIAENQLSTLDVTNNVALTRLQANQNLFTAPIDVSQNVELLNLSLNNNPNLGNINVSSNTKLTRLNLSTTGSNAIDVSTNIALEEFFIAVNSYTTLDVSANVALRQLLVNNNSLTSLNLKNGNNANLTQFNVRYNPNLECALIDDVNAVGNLGLKDAQTIYSDTVCFGLADYTMIPDAAFEARLIELGIDSQGTLDGRALTADLEVVTTLSAGIFAITDFTGIEAFRDLEILNVYNAQITSIDLSNNLKLRELYLGNQNNTLATLTSLDITNNVLLEKLEATNNALTGLNVSNNPNLTLLDVAGNQITTLDVTGLPLLEELDFAENQLSTLDVTNNVALTRLQGNDNLLVGAVNVSNNTNLTSLSLNNNAGLGNMNVATNVNLIRLNLSTTGSTMVDVSTNLVLEEFFVASNMFTALDVSTNTALKQIGASFNQITALDFSNNASLQLIRVENNALTSLNLKNGNNANITQFDISKNPNLECVLVDDVNAVSNLGNKDAQTNYSSITCSTERLTFVPDDNFEQYLIDQGYDSGDLDDYVPTANIEVVTLITLTGRNTADLTGIEDFTALEKIAGDNSGILTLDVSNNLALVELNLANCPISTLDITKNVEMKILRLQGTQISKIDVSQNLKLEFLRVDSSQISDINLSSNIALKSLKADNAGFQNLDVTNNVNLKQLLINNNQLTGIDLTENAVLEELNASSNSIINIDINQNVRLKNLNLSNNKIERAFLKNGANSLITNFDIRNNPDLMCIAVDDVSFSTTNWTNKDATANYNTDCSSEWTVYTTDTSLNTALVDLGTNLDSDGDGKITYEEAQAFTGTLNLSGKNISNVLGLEAFTNAEVIDISGNVITDISSLLKANSVLVQSKTTGEKRTFARKANKIKKLIVANNLIEEIDISKLSDITEIDARNNNLTFLNLKNGNNTKIIALDVTGNPNLGCIEVDDVAVAETNLKWKKDATASYSLSCKALSVDVNFLEANISLYPNPVDSVVEISLSNGLELRAVEVYNLVGKKLLTTKNASVIVEELSSGIYFLKILTDKGTVNKRIVKK